jgi:hypothetical protein
MELFCAPTAQPYMNQLQFSHAPEQSATEVATQVLLPRLGMSADAGVRELFLRTNVP